MPEHILLVEDNEDDLELYVDLLQRSKNGRVIHTTDCLQEAVDIFKEFDIHCTFIDYNLPQLNGIEILNELSSIVKGRVLAAVILTGEPKQEIQAEAARNGAIDYIVKDINNTPEELNVIIGKTCDWARRLNIKTH